MLITTISKNAEGKPFTNGVVIENQCWDTVLLDIEHKFGSQLMNYISNMIDENKIAEVNLLYKWLM